MNSGKAEQSDSESALPEVDAVSPGRTQVPGPIRHTSSARIIGVIWEARTALAAAAGGLLAFAGYLALDAQAAELGVAATDLAFDSGAFVVLAAGIVGIAVLLASVPGGVALLVDRRLEGDVPNRLRWAAVVLAALGLGVSYLLVDQLQGFGALAGVVAAMALLGFIAGMIGRWPGDDQRAQRAGVFALLVLLPLATALLAGYDTYRGGSDLANYAKDLAVGSPDVGSPPASILGFASRPSRGWVVTESGTEFCAVRVSSGVYLVPEAAGADSAQTLLLQPLAFRMAACSPEPYTSHNS